MCADQDKERLKIVKNLYPAIETTINYKDIINNPKIDAVCVASPTNTHYAISKEGLAAGKHILCEKPLALTTQECQELQDLAEKTKKILLVGHIFLFNEGIICLKKYITSKELGSIYYAHVQRTNLGPFRYDVNALWDLAPHDIAIFNYLFDGPPVAVSARGGKYLGTNLEDIAFATLEYPQNILVNLHVSWLDPKKVRQITIVGDKKMVVWDDLDHLGPIKLYDKHVERTSTFYESYGEFQLLSKEGSITIPKVGITEPLKKQAQHFLECIEKNKASPLSDAKKGLDVVKTLMAIEESMRQKGKQVSLT